jgi:hypothetical protein
VNDLGCLCRNRTDHGRHPVSLLRQAPLALLAFGGGRDDHSSSGRHTFRQPLRSSDTFQVQATHGYAA